MAGSQLPGQYETWPPGAATSTAAMLQSVDRVLGRLVDLLANESVKTNQPFAKNLPANKGTENDVKDGAVIKNGEDEFVSDSAHLYGNADRPSLVNENIDGDTGGQDELELPREDGNHDPGHGGQMWALQHSHPGTLIKISVCTPSASTQILLFP